MPRLAAVEPQRSHFSDSQDSSPSNTNHGPTKWQSAIETFNPMWFSICISSGGLGLVLNAPFPYPAQWLTICGDVLFGLELLLFAAFLTLMAARWILYPRSALHRLLSDQQELSAYAIVPITLLTISALVASQVSTAPAWGGYPFTLVAYVLWWLGMTMMTLYCVAVISILSYSEQRIGKVMMPALFMPIVGVATAAVEAASVSANAYELSTRLAVPMVVMGYFLLGLATWMALMLYTMFLYRLMTHGWPDTPGVAGLAILVGPAGQIASGFLLLGQAAGEDFAQYASGTFFTEQTGAIFQGASTMMGMLFMGLSFMWFMVAAYAIIDLGLVKGRTKYTLTWWAVVFPIVTLDTAMIQMAKLMDSPAFRVLATALFVLLLLGYLINWVLTIWSVFKGDVFFPPRAQTSNKEAEMEADHTEDNADRSDGSLLV